MKNILLSLYNFFYNQNMLHIVQKIFIYFIYNDLLNDFIVVCLGLTFLCGFILLGLKGFGIREFFCFLIGRICLFWL
jgi:hypothetical protein